MTTAKGVTVTALEALHAATPDEEVKTKVARARGGRPIMRDGQPLLLAYVTARYVADVLDAAITPPYWQDSYERLADGAVKCGIGILIDGEWVWKFDVGIPTNIEPAKGAFSDAFKRAGVKWGIARDLYDERDDEHSDDREEQQDAAPRRPIQSRLADGEDEEEQQPRRFGGRTSNGGGNARRGGGYSRGGGGNVRRFQPRQPAPQVDPEDAPWVCPDHDDVKVVPGGVSNRTGKEYGPFYACPVPGCDQRGPFMDA